MAHSLLENTCIRRRPIRGMTGRSRILRRLAFPFTAAFFRERLAGFCLAALVSAALSGCAGNAPSSKPPFIEARSQLYVGLPAVPSGVDSLFATRGWTPGLFASELRKELRLRLNRMGVSTPEDSVVTLYRLELSVDIYRSGVYAGQARLSTPHGRREIGFRNPRTGNEARFDASLEDIRLMAKAIAEGAYTDPRRKKEERLKYKVDPLMTPMSF